MGGLRSWAGSLLSLVTFFIVRSVTAGLAAPMFVAVSVACIYIWILVLRVPELADIKPEKDHESSGPIAPGASDSVSVDATPTKVAESATSEVVESATSEVVQDPLTASGSTTCASIREADALPDSVQQVGVDSDMQNAPTKAETADVAHSVTQDVAGSFVSNSSADAVAENGAAAGSDGSPSADMVSNTSPSVPASGSTAACNTVACDTTADAVPPHATTEQAELSTSVEDGCTVRDTEEADRSDAGAHVAEETVAEDHDAAEKNDDGAGGATDFHAAEESAAEEKDEGDGGASDDHADEDSDASTDEEERRRREQEEEDEHADPERAQELRLEGNDFFKAGKLHDAREAYSEALYLTPSADKKEKSVLFSNRAACHLKLSRWEDVVSDCKQAIELDENYAKAYNRRSVAYENLGRWHDANEDLKKAIELDPSLRSKEYKRQAMLESRAQEQFEKDKDEMMGKLKDLGNMVLGKFGMSVDNFKCEKDPNSGSYSVKFQS